MNWDNKTVLKFLELYQMHSCIWNPQNETHKNRQCVNDAWNDIKCKLGVTCTIKDLKKKKESLMSAYRACKTKIKKSERSGSGAADVYQPTWFAYSLMDSFLGSIYSCDATINTETEVFENTNAVLNEDSNTSSTITPINTPKTTTDATITSKDTTITSTDTTMTPTASKRRLQHNPPELIQAKKQMDEAFNFMKQVSQQKPPTDPDDECSTFGILIAKKMRKLSEERRDIMMVKINQLFIDERYNFNQANSISTDSYTYTSPPQTSYQVSYQQISSPPESNTSFTAPVHDEYSNSHVDDREYILPIMNNNTINDASASAKPSTSQHQVPYQQATSPQDYSSNFTAPVDLENKYILPTRTNNTIYDGAAKGLKDFIIFKAK